MIREPLNSFADRIVQNNEIAEFISALIAKGGQRAQETIMAAANEHRYVRGTARYDSEEYMDTARQLPNVPRW